MESRFGHDFSNVQVHTDRRAAESAQAVDARAYTVGSHIVFGPGRYAPETDSGQRLIAHELTHVIQQSAAMANPSRVARQTDINGSTGAEASMGPSDLDVRLGAVIARLSAAAEAGGPGVPADAKKTIARFSALQASGTEGQKRALLDRIERAAAVVPTQGAQASHVELSQPGDPFEREADAAAHEVMSARSGVVRVTGSAEGARTVQRQAAEAGTIVLVEAGPIGWAILGVIALTLVAIAATNQQDRFKGDCYSGRDCDGKVLQRRVLHCHNCKKHVSGRSILRPDGTCERC